MTIFIILLISFVFPESPNIVWQKTFGGNSRDQGSCVCQTFDGGYILAGFTTSFGQGNEDLWLIKLDSLGDTIWTRTYGKQGSDFGASVIQTSDGGFIVLGSISLANNSRYMWLVKTDSFGDTLWTKTYGTGQNGAHHIVQTPDKGFIFTGRVGDIFPDTWLVRTDSLGDTLWTRTFEIYGIYYCASISSTNDGGFILGGYTDNLFYWDQPDGQDFDLLLIKIDSLGNTLWTKIIGRDYSDHGYEVQQTINGGYVIAGETRSFGDDYGDVWLVQTDSLGDTVWTRTYGGPEHDRAHSICQTRDSGFILTGWSNSFVNNDWDIYIVRTDFKGDTLWTKTVSSPGVDNGKYVRQTSDNGFIITGFTSPLGEDSCNAWLIKIGPESDTTNIESASLNNENTFGFINNHPNPFNPSTSISYNLGPGRTGTLQIFDIRRKMVFRRVVQGSGTLIWVAKGLGSGVYVLKIISGGKKYSRKLILQR